MDLDCCVVDTAQEAGFGTYGILRNLTTEVSFARTQSANKFSLS